MAAVVFWMQMSSLELYPCPRCGSQIPPEDVNDEKDVALCRKCAKGSTLPQIGMAAEIAEACAGKTPRGVRVENNSAIHSASHADGVEIRCNGIDKTALLGLPFFLLWEGLLFYYIFVPQIKAMTFNWMAAFIGLAFMLMPAKNICEIAFGLFGRHVITLRRGELACFSGIGRLGRARSFAYSRDAKVSLRKFYVKNNLNEYNDEIAVASQGRTFAMCATMPDAPKPYIAGVIQREIARGA